MKRLFAEGFPRPKKDRSGAPEPAYWGGGWHGVLTGNEPIMLHGTTEWEPGSNFIAYQEFAVRHYTEINWDAGMAVDAPCRGLIIFSQGDVYLGPNSSISMAKSATFLPCDPEWLYYYSTGPQMKHIVETLCYLKGGYGGNGGKGSPYAGAAGTGGPGRVCQGGFGGGGSAPGVDSVNKGGDGGSIVYPEVNGFPGKNARGNGLWGGGGNPYISGNRHFGGGRPYGGGGAGAGTTTEGRDGEPAGGLILIIAGGRVTISGTLDVSGGAGGSNTSGGGGGGGAGGGVVAIFARGTIDISAANIILNGGAGGTGFQNGTPGGPGTLYTEQI